MMVTKGIIIAGLSGGTGKSVVAVGLAAYLQRRNIKTVSFKKGPDYIDAGWLAQATKTPCYNLDPYLMTEEVIRQLFVEHSDGAEIVLVEGNRGLFDGVDAKGGYSTAELAILLQLPVILVVNCAKITRTVAAMVLGCRMLDERVDLRGVILNNVATDRQKEIITSAVEESCSIPVVGVVPRMGRDIFPMRHLGMTPHQEYQGCEEALESLAKIVSTSVDHDRFMACMAPVALPEMQYPSSKQMHKAICRIGVIQDAAFQFYYPGNFEALEREGAELVTVNALDDQALPQLDGLYIGGGFPETNAPLLSSNRTFLESVKMAADTGLPIYAECGGLIYLGETLSMDGTEYPMTAVLPIKFGMSKKPQAHGYSVFEVVGKNPFYAVGEEVKGHEFRYSTVLEWRGPREALTVKMKRGTGFWEGRDGITYNNVFALYTHVHACGTPQWAAAFVAACMRLRQG